MPAKLACVITWLLCCRNCLVSAEELASALADLGATVTTRAGIILSVTVGGKIPHDVMEALSREEALVELNISSAKVDAIRFSEIRGFEFLRLFSASETAIRDGDLVFLSNAKDLTSFSLSQTCVRGVGLANLAKSRRLTHMSISGKELGEASLTKALSQLKCVRSLHIYGENISVNIAESLKGLDSLADLRVGGSAPASLMKQRLEAALPRVSVLASEFQSAVDPFNGRPLDCKQRPLPER